jgi:hypothetical protein
VSTEKIVFTKAFFRFVPDTSAPFSDVGYTGRIRGCQSFFSKKSKIFKRLKNNAVLKGFSHIPIAARRRRAPKTGLFHRSGGSFSRGRPGFKGFGQRFYLLCAGRFRARA